MAELSRKRSIRLTRILNPANWRTEFNQFPIRTTDINDPLLPKLTPSLFQAGRTRLYAELAKPVAIDVLAKTIPRADRASGTLHQSALAFACPVASTSVVLPVVACP
jgi:hypothetical protein